MPELDPTRDADQADEEYLADAYAALDDDRRQKDADSVAETMDVDTSSAATGTDGEPQTAQPTTADDAPTEARQQPAETPASDNTAEPSVGSARRVFLIE
jgi:hypothetical protein